MSLKVNKMTSGGQFCMFSIAITLLMIFTSSDQVCIDTSNLQYRKTCEHVVADFKENLLRTKDEFVAIAKSDNSPDGDEDAAGHLAMKEQIIQLIKEWPSINNMTHEKEEIGRTRLSEIIIKGEEKIKVYKFRLKPPVLLTMINRGRLACQEWKEFSRKVEACICTGNEPFNLAVRLGYEPC